MTPNPQLLPRELASALVKELDDRWLVMHEINKEPMTLAFMGIIGDHSYASHSPSQSEREKVPLILNELESRLVLLNEISGIKGYSNVVEIQKLLKLLPLLREYIQLRIKGGEQG